jgi:hypothetical protein
VTIIFGAQIICETTRHAVNIAGNTVKHLIRWFKDFKYD